MEPLATYLKSARESKQVTLEQISAATRISARHYQSIEAGRYKDLPGGVYNRAFIKAYCDYLKLESEDVLARYEEETAPPKNTVVKAKPTIPEIGPSLKPHPHFVWGVMLLVSVAGLFLSRKWIAEVFAPYFSHPTVPELAATPPAAHSVPQHPAPTPSVMSATAPAAPISPSPAPTTVAASTAQIIQTPVPPGAIRLEFEVLQECWVSVNRDGDRVLEKILEPGDEQAFNASQRFFVVLGNAGGVRLKINGKQAKPLGKPGEVVKVLINEQNIKDLIEKS
ncbi:MAG TPA: RodZ domain-containing protein [Acidobacteriota bacterium]|nr:RodZ domain-containing protein [Acidobacteriota bacterium]